MLTTLVIVFGLCVLAVIHPYVTYPLSLIVISLFKKVPLNSTGPAPASYALISCAHNERAVIEQKVENLLQVRDRLGNCEVLVHSDGSVDGTTEFLKTREGDIRVSIFETRSGKTAGINKLMSMATADIVILSDANVMIDLDSIKNIERYFRDPTVGCVACKLVYTNEKDSDTAQVGSKYRRFEEYAKAVETSTGSIVYADGTLFAVRRSLFVPVPADLTDDFFVALTVLCAGYRIVAAPDVMALERAAVVRKDEFKRRVRIGCNSFSCHVLFWKKVLQFDGLTIYKYVSHKLLRWLSAYFIGLGALAALGIVFLLLGSTACLLAIAAGLLLAWLGSTGKVPVLSQAWEAFAAIIATGYGVFLCVNGQRFLTWTSPSSSRE